MLTTGAAGGGGGGGGGAAATAPPPPPPPPIIIIIIIIMDGSDWFLLLDRFWIELVICVSMVVSWSLEPDREVTRDAPPWTPTRSLEVIEPNRVLCGAMVDSFVVTQDLQSSRRASAPAAGH